MVKPTGNVLLVPGAPETTTTIAPRVVGEPLPLSVVLVAGLALLALIVVAGLVARRRS